jgi:hypothetical protein
MLAEYVYFGDHLLAMIRPGEVIECGFYLYEKEYSNQGHIDLRDKRNPKNTPDKCTCKNIREGEQPWVENSNS